MAKLYELQATFNQVMELIDDPDANLDVLESVLKEVEGEFDQKIEGCVMMVKNMEAETVGIKAEVDRLSARKKALVTGGAEAAADGAARLRRDA